MATRIGIMFDGFDSAGDMLAVVGEAERAGARAVWMAQHMGYREAVVACAAFAGRTEKAVLVPTAISPYLWHPTPTAMALATLDELAPGRIAIAVSVGNILNLRESGEAPVKPVRALREFTEDLRALLAGKAVSRDGLTYRLDGARMAFTPSAPIPVYIASTGPQVLALAGRMADGVLLSGGLTLAYMEKCLGWVCEGAEGAGRDVSGLRRAGFIYAAVSPDGREAVAELKLRLAFLFRNDRQAGNIASSGLPIDHEAIMAAVARRDMAEAIALIPDEAVEAFCVGGTPAQARDRLAAYIGAGMDEPVLQVCGTAENRKLALDLVRDFSGS